MLAALPISRPNRPAIHAPSIPDALGINVVDAIVVGLIGLTVLALAAPSIALAVLVVAGIVGARGARGPRRHVDAGTRRGRPDRPGARDEGQLQLQPLTSALPSTADPIPRVGGRPFRAATRPQARVRAPRTYHGR